MIQSRFTPACLLLAALLIALPCIGQTAGPASLSAASGSRIIPPAASYHFPESETLVYSVEWHLLNAGTATVNLKRQGNSEHLRSIANTSGVVNKIFAVHDLFDSDIDTRNFCTQQISKHSEEGARRIERSVLLNYQTRRSHMEESDLKTGSKRKSDFDIPPCVSDVVSGFFYVASLDMAPGFSQIFPVNDGGKTTDVKIEVEGHNRVKVPFGEFDALRVKAEPVPVR